VGKFFFFVLILKIRPILHREYLFHWFKLSQPVQKKMDTTGEEVLEFLVATNLKLKGKKSKKRRGETNTLRYLRPREAHGSSDN